MTTSPLPDPVLSRIVVAETVPADGLAVTVVPTAEERAALARFNGLVAVKDMTGALRLSPMAGGGVRVTGEVAAAVTQSCVVSLEPFDAMVREPVDVSFLPPAGLARFRAQYPAGQDDPDAPEEPDLIEHGRIDVGALAAEHLTLGLDPYPKKPGAALAVAAVPEEPPASPFAILRTRR